MAGAGIGIILALIAILVSGILDGTSPVSFFNISALLVIFGGTFGATIASYSLAEVKMLPKLIAKTMKPRTSSSAKLRESLVQFAEQARREGLLSLEQAVEGVADPFVKRGLQMIIDGLEPDTVEEALELEIEAMQRRHGKWSSVFQSMGGYAPTMGIIGTVMGLVGVLSKLAEPEKLGESIATAFIATLIGILTANVLWLPMASNLKQQSEAEAAERRMALVGIMAIQAGENPRIVAQKLASMADPEKAAKGAAAAPATARGAATEEPA